MKATGMVRNVDELGRIVLPIELRRTLGVAERDPMEIYVDGDKIVLKRYVAVCLFCRKSDGLIQYREKNTCKSCAGKLADLAES